MTPFVRLTAIAAPYDRINVDTDQLLPARYLLKRRTDPAYARYLFHDLRFNADGSEKAEFVLNQPAYRKAEIIVGNRNFGGGSSREAAAFALDACGIRCVIAVSFGDIFYSNCIKNGILPIRLADATAENIRKQLQARPGATLAVDLPAQTVTDPADTVHRFEIDSFRKTCLLEGLSEISLTLRNEPAIAAFETRYRQTVSWL